MNNLNKILDSLENKTTEMDIAKIGTIVSHNTGDNTVDVSFGDGTPTLSGLAVAGYNSSGFSIKQEFKAGDKAVVLVLDGGTGGNRNVNNAVCLGAIGGTVEPNKLVIEGKGVRLELSNNIISIDAPDIKLSGDATLNGREIKTE